MHVTIMLIINRTIQDIANNQLSRWHGWMQNAQLNVLDISTLFGLLPYG